MAFVVKDRVRETTTTTGTGTITLGGAVSGYQAFSAIGDGNTTYYTIAGLTEWEVGIGTYTASGTTLSRDTLIASSTGSAIDFSAGTKDVFVGLPAEKAVEIDTTQTLSGKTIQATKEVKTALGANDIDLSAGNYFTKTISGATTLTVSNVPATGTGISFVFEVTNGGSATITWWSGVKWEGGTAPTLTSSGKDILCFYTHDGGTIWNGLVAGKDVK